MKFEDNRQRTLGLITGLLTFSISCFLAIETFVNTYHPAEKESAYVTTVENSVSLYEHWQNYLATKQIKPVVTIKPEERITRINSHVVEWIQNSKSPDERGYRPGVLSINGDEFIPENAESTNLSSGYRNPFRGNSLYQIDYYNHRGRELIGAEFEHLYCNGRWCQWSYYLLYNPRTREKHYFVSYCSKIDLYDFESKGDIATLVQSSSEGHCFEDNKTIWRPYVLSSSKDFGLSNDHFVSVAISQKEDPRLFELDWFESIPGITSVENRRNED